MRAAGGGVDTRGWCESRPLKPQSCSPARCRIRRFRLGCTAKRPRYIARFPGGMAEWLKAHAWKACIRATVSWVRIPLPPPTSRSPLFADVR
jgi:hypothetical protein